MTPDYACCCGPRRASLGTIAAGLVALVIGNTTPVVAQQDTRSDPAVSGFGASYWGPIAPPADSVLGVSTNRSLPVWEAALVWPYRVVAFPFRLLADGIGSTVEFVDETPVLRGLFSLKPQAFRITPELNVGGLSGFGAGIAIEHDSITGPGHQLRLRAAGTNQGDKRVTLGLRWPIAARGRLTVGSGFRDHANTRFYGLGPGSMASDRSLFREVQAWVGVDYRYELGHGLAVTAAGLLSADHAEDAPGDSAQSITQVFAGNLPPGFASTSSGVSAIAGIEHRDTDGDGRPNHGGIRVAKALYFHSHDARWASHWSFRADVQQFVRLWFPHTVLALRGVLSWLEPVGDAPIPFQRLLHNNDPDLLRGFPDRRWRDRGLVLLTAEYRWPLWVYNRAEGTGIDAYLLTDIGQVFPNLAAMTTEDLTFSVGGGIRLLSAGGFVLRLEYAHSDEGGVWRLQSSQAFQFTQGLFHGRDAVPVR